MMNSRQLIVLAVGVAIGFAVANVYRSRVGA